MSIPSGKVIACDTETTGVNVWQGCRPFCFTFCNEKGKTGYFYWKVNPSTRRPIIKLEDLREMQEFFSDPNISKVFHNAKFDMWMLKAIGVEVKGRVEDTLLAAHT